MISEDEQRRMEGRSHRMLKQSVREAIESRTDTVITWPTNEGKTEHILRQSAKDHIDATLAIDNGRAGGMYEEMDERWSEHGADPVIGPSFVHDSSMMDEEYKHYDEVRNLYSRGLSPAEIREYIKTKYTHTEPEDDQSSLTEFMDFDDESPLPDSDPYLAKREALGTTGANIVHTNHLVLKDVTEDHVVMLDDSSITNFRTEATLTDDDILAELDEYLDYIDAPVDAMGLLDMDRSTASSVLDAVNSAPDRTVVVSNTSMVTADTGSFVVGMAIHTMKGGRCPSWSTWQHDVRVTVVDDEDEHGDRKVTMKLWRVPEYLSCAGAIIVVSATPYMPGWETFYDMLGREFEFDTAPEGAFTEKIDEQFERVVQVSDYFHPGSSGDGVSMDQVRNRLKLFNQLEHTKPFVIAPKKFLETMEREIDDLDDLIQGTMNCAQGEATNDLSHIQHLYIPAVPYPGDDEVKHLANFAGADAARGDTTGKNIQWNTDEAHRAFEHLTSDVIYQNMSRIARANGGGVAWIDTCMIPDFVPRRAPKHGARSIIVSEQAIDLSCEIHDTFDRGEIITTDDLFELFERQRGTELSQRRKYEIIKQAREAGSLQVVGHSESQKMMMAVTEGWDFEKVSEAVEPDCDVFFTTFVQWANLVVSTDDVAGSTTRFNDWSPETNKVDAYGLLESRRDLRSFRSLSPATPG